MEKTHYSDAQFRRDIPKLACRIKRLGTPKNIYGFPRGGLVVAVNLSHLLNCPVILRKKQISWRTLLVDDICDDGKTIARLAKRTGVAIVTLFANEKRKKIRAWNCRLIYARPKNGKLIVFPWETNESAKIDYKKKAKKKKK